mgnify:CR=1 FL=1
MTTENSLRERIALHGRSLCERGYGCGSSGNISVRLEDGILVTPTNSSMGRLDPARTRRAGFGRGSGDRGGRRSRPARSAMSPAARVRLNAITARTSQALFAVNTPEGR